MFFVQVETMKRCRGVKKTTKKMEGVGVGERKIRILAISHGAHVFALSRDRKRSTLTGTALM
jgi:hypothetical protein